MKVLKKFVKSVEAITIPPEKREQILNQLREALKLVTKKSIEVNDLLSIQYSTNKDIRFQTSILRSDLWLSWRFPLIYLKHLIRFGMMVSFINARVMELTVTSLNLLNLNRYKQVVLNG